MKAIKAFIFDLDGVLTETSEQHFLAWQQLANELGISIEREFNETLKGVSRMESLERILEHGGVASNFSEEEKLQLATKKNENYVEMIKNFTEENQFEGVSFLLRQLKDLGIKIALASASKNGPRLIEAMGIKKYFDYVVDPAKIKHGKPAPDIFIKAAEALGVDTSECVGVEDAKAGVQAIKAAGMLAIGIGDKEVLSQADIIYPETKDIKISEILNG